jgi:hypothetical protein
MLVAALFVAAALAAAVGATAAPLPAAKTSHDRAAWRSILHWPKTCEQGWVSTATPGSGIDLTPAGAAGVLVAVECFPGAYQGDAMLYLARSRSQTTGPLVFQVYEDPGNGHPHLVRATTILGVLTFSKSTGTLIVLDKYAGLGGCGIYSTYRLESGRFVLAAARSKPDCDGKQPYAPQRWPKLPVPASR